MNWIDLCNSALLLVGGAAVNTLDEPTREARGCKAFLDQTKTSILAAHPWNCATSWHAPALVGEAGKNGFPAWPYRYAYGLPPDCLRVLRIETGFPAARPVPFLVAREKERLILLCDREQITVVYIADIADPDMIAPKLRDAIILQLAAKLALYLAGSRSLMEAYDAGARTALREAVLHNAREGYEE